MTWNIRFFIFCMKNSYFNEGWLFIGSLKVGSALGMKKKEMLAQFIYKPA